MLEIEWLGALVAYGIICALACYAIIPVLIKYELKDNENDRSSHKGSTPRGGGIAFVPLLLIALFASWALLPAQPHWLFALAIIAGFTAVSFIDDLINLGASIRFATHLFLAVILVFFLPPELVPQFEFLPVWLIKTAMVFAFVWWINLYNFMDGIDGITVVETGSISIGLIILFAVHAGGVQNMATIGAALCLVTALAFSLVNWHPARVFMGDIGSVTLAAVTGYLILIALGNQQWEAALILPLYYTLDATGTLLWRLFKAEKFWQAHRQHAYQVYVAKGYRHADACWKILALNILLVFLSTVNFAPLWLRTLIAFGASLWLIYHFRRAKILSGS